MQFYGNTADGLYVSILSALINNGDVVVPRGQPTREIRGVNITLTNTDYNVIGLRKLNFRFMVAEFLWLLTGQNRAEIIGKFNSVIPRFSDDGIYMSGSYGPPISDQIGWVVQQLKDDPDTRQAVLTIWRPRPGGTKDVPCTVAMQFMLRSGGLEMMTYMRSNDAVLGLPYDLFVFTMIQRYIASALNATAGKYHHHVGSLHLYERDLPEAKKALSRSLPHINSAALMPTYPWPMQALEALLTAPDPPGGDLTMDRGWANIVSVLIPEQTQPIWKLRIKEYGVEPVSYKGYV